MSQKLSVIIPAYNEEGTIEAVVRRVQAADIGPLEKEIIVVDDGSQDGTLDILKGLSGIRYLAHQRNAGKGAALSTGFQAATGDILLIQDADLEYDPEDYRAVIQPIVDGRSEVVMGSRFLLERPVFLGKRRSPYLAHYLGNLLIVRITNLLYRRRFTDYEGCYKAFARNALASVRVGAQGFEYDNELICKLMRTGARIVEVPIQYSPRTYEHGKKITWRHGLIILWTIIKWRILPL
jgi:glycosyltransferase involved in cell wall biosynthesis